MNRLATAICLACWIALSSASVAETQRSVSNAAMADRVDALLEARWRAEGVTPAELSTDSEFLRRVHLDLVGVLPRVSDARRFLSDQRADKRAVVIDQLIASPRHATHLANTWRRIMLPGGNEFQETPSVTGVQNWLRRQFAANMRYDRIVSDFLVATGGGDTGPGLFYTSLELKPEKLAASTARIFLGLRIECAECHDHPFDDWTQNDFWAYAAFFAQLQRADEMRPGRPASLIDLTAGDVTLPETEQVILPKYPGGRPADPGAGGTRRVQLAIWMASRDNPFLPRAAVNRAWSLLFGRGLVEPVDDLGKHNPPSHPRLMSELTDYFVDTGFDLRELLRTLANTRAYQLSSAVADRAADPELFASMAVKTMTADQLFDCLDRLLSRPPPQSNLISSAAGFDPRRLAFAAKMRMRGANATEFDAGVLQALTMLNGAETAALTDHDRSGLLRALGAPFLTDQQRVETLFLATLSRFPTGEERELFVEYVAGGGPPTARALGDVLWALLNSAEFELNH